jgi:hypothetical protein
MQPDAASANNTAADATRTCFNIVLDLSRRPLGVEDVPNGT